MNKLFNSIVIVALILTVIYWVMPSIDKYWLSDEELDLLSANGWGSVFPNSSFIYWPLLAYWVIVSLGLLKRIKIARTLYAIGIVIFSIASFMWGFSVLTPIEAGMSNILSLLDGAILVMAFLTSISNEFNASPNK